mmetsp:Transcript_10623/g.21970  ORF Transcript_10623/g.21970 Transcript_10623/m.21970 type:complete len:148 (-) Transcript_10623:82-525(-)
MSGPRLMVGPLCVVLLCLQVSPALAFVTNYGSFVPALRPPHRSQCLASNKSPSLRVSPASLTMVGVESVPGLLLSEEIFGQVAAGGVAIIFSGVIGALVVGQIANIEDLEERWSENTPGSAVESVNEDYDDGENVVAKVKKEDGGGV